MLQKVLPALIATEVESSISAHCLPDLEQDNIFDQFATSIMEGCKDMELKQVCCLQNIA